MTSDTEVCGRRADEPTNGELERLIVALERNVEHQIQSIADRLERYMLAAVYRANERARTAREEALADRIARVEKASEANQQAALNHAKTNRLLFWTVAAGVLASVTTVVLTVLLTHGGSG